MAGAGAPGAVNRQAGGRGCGVAGPETQKTSTNLYFYAKPVEISNIGGGYVYLTQHKARIFSFYQFIWELDVLPAAGKAWVVGRRVVCSPTGCGAADSSPISWHSAGFW